MTVDHANLRRLAEDATKLPWVVGDPWMLAGELPERFGAGRCGFCERLGEPEWRGRRDINGTVMPVHVHRSSDPYGGAHRISRDDPANPGAIVGNYDYDEGGIVSEADTAYIVAACNAVPELLDEIEALKAENTSRTELARECRDVFVDCISDYERLRGYLVTRYNDNADNHEIATWLAEHDHGLFVEGVPEADEWPICWFVWPSPSTQPDNEGQRLTDDEVDEIVQSQYEDALAEGEPWAEEVSDGTN